MTGVLRVGTSGWAYEEWRHGVFYPEGVSARGMLRHYAGAFRTVEANYTFRHFPATTTLEDWRDQTPDGFRFALKANQRITHHRRLVGVGADVAAFAERVVTLDDRLGPVLFQCPPELHYDRGVLESFADCIPPDLTAAMEFRHPSFGEEARTLLSARGIGWCVAETDEHDSDDRPLTDGPPAYLRLRRTSYEDHHLAAWARRISGTLDTGVDVYCFFRHEDTGTGPRWAARLAELVEVGG